MPRLGLSVLWINLTLIATGLAQGSDPRASGLPSSQETGDPLASPSTEEPGPLGRAQPASAFQMSLIDLLLIQAVQQDLDLSTEQIREIRTKNNQQDSQFGSMFLSYKERYRLVEQSRQELSQFLDETQLARLMQIFYQAQGLRAIVNPPISDQLKLTEDQRQQCLQIVAAESRKLQEFLAPYRDSFRGTEGKELSEESFRIIYQRQCQHEQALLDQAGTVLTRPQRATWLNQITGKHLPLPPNVTPGGRAMGP